MGIIHKNEGQYHFGAAFIDEPTLGDAKFRIKKIGISAPADGTETGTDYIIPSNAVVYDVFLYVSSPEETGTTQTLSVGTDSTDGGDADGFLVDIDVSTAGMKKGTLANGGVTLGALLQVDTDGMGAVVREADVTSAGTEVTITAGSDDWAEFEGSIYIVLVGGV